MASSEQGGPTGRERDELATALLHRLRRLLRELPDEAVEAPIEAAFEELRALAADGRGRCTDALAGALLDAQILALERGDRGEAWRRLDELRARLHGSGAPDLLQDRLAAALFNAHRGGLLLDDEPMRLAALEELRMRARFDPSAAACRVALAELLADRVATSCEDGDEARVADSLAELEQLERHDRGFRVARELARALREQLVAFPDREAEALARLRALGEVHQDGRVDLERARALGRAHARHRSAAVDEDADADADEAGESADERADAALEALRALVRARGEGEPSLIRELARVLRDVAVFGLGAWESEGAGAGLPGAAERGLNQLRLIHERHPADLELGHILLEALLQVHLNAAELGLDEVCEYLQAEADSLLEHHTEAQADAGARARQPTQRRLGPRAGSEREVELLLALRREHLRMLVTTHARVGDRGEWVRAELLLSRARNLVDLAGGSLGMVELFAQMLVNAHVDAGDSRGGDGAPSELAQALLVELRALARQHLGSSALQRHLGTALFNAHVDASRRSEVLGGDLRPSEALLEELEALCRANPGQLELPRRLIMALVNHHGMALERGDRDRGAVLLARIRELGSSPEADDHLRVQLAMALGNTLAHSESFGLGQDSARLAHELRVLAARKDASPTLRALVLEELSERFAPKQ